MVKTHVISAFNPQEPHLTVLEVATNLHISTCCARDIFAKEPGVIHISRRTSSHERPPSKNGHKKPRKWEMLRIPFSVFLRVYRRLRGEDFPGGER